MTAPSTRPHVVLAAGGTGGHVFPALAVADALRVAAPSVDVSICGTGRAWEMQRVTAAGFEYVAVPCAPWSLRPAGLCRAIGRNLAGFRFARRWLLERRTRAVIGFGGYASVPMGRAAAATGIPLLVVEPNVVPGRANRWLSRWASVVCAGFVQTAEFMPRARYVVVTGMPIRRDITCGVHAGRATATDRRTTLLILGGSQGAQSLNQAVLAALPRLRSQLAGWTVLHQTGAADFESVRGGYASLGISADVRPFIEDMAAAYRQAGLAVSRAGASTLAELAVAGVPAVLLPYPHAADNHQWHNAHVLAQAGAACVIRDDGSGNRAGGELAMVLGELLADAARRTTMLAALEGIARPDAATRVVELACRWGGIHTARAGRVAA